MCSLIFETEVTDPDNYAAAYDLVIASDGASSVTRRKYEDVFKPNIQVRKNRFIWLGTKKKLDAFTFDFRQTEWGWFNLHAYRFDADWSTFIVETPEENWLKARHRQDGARGIDRPVRKAVRRTSRWQCPHLQRQASAWFGGMAEICPHTV